jgi:hypothetical protein
MTIFNGARWQISQNAPGCQSALIISYLRCYNNPAIPPHIRQKQQLKAACRMKGH